MRLCEYCGKPRHAETKRFCSQSCSMKWRTAQPEFKKKFYTPERSRKLSIGLKAAHARNPDWAKRTALIMANLPLQQRIVIGRKISATLRNIGHKPKIRGGNGTGPTEPEKLLLKMFPGTKWNYPVKTGMRAGSGFPTCYKVDVAFLDIRLAIEADGSSHVPFVRKQKDLKKTQFLMGLGWTVLRFKNRMILEQTEMVRKQIEFTICMLKGIHPTVQMDLFATTASS